MDTDHLLPNRDGCIHTSGDVKYWSIYWLVNMYGLGVTLEWKNLAYGAITATCITFIVVISYEYSIDTNNVSDELISSSQ